MVLAMAEVAAESKWAQALGQALRDALGDRTQRWLADEVGIDPATVSRFVQGKQLPTLDQLSKMARALNVSTRSLLARAGYIDDNGLIDPDRLPVAGRRAIRAILREFQESVDGDSPNHPNGS